MAGITHTKVSEKADGVDESVVRPVDWNANHTIGYPLTIGPLTFEVGGVAISGGGELNFVNTNFVCKECRISGYLDHSGSRAGFFGKAPVVKTEVADLTVTDATGGGEGATAATVASVNVALGEIKTKLNALLDALQAYGLV